MRSRAWITSSAFVVFGWFERVKRAKQKNTRYAGAGEQERSAIGLIHKPMQSEIRLHGFFLHKLELTLLNYSCSIDL